MNTFFTRLALIVLLAVTGGVHECKAQKLEEALSNPVIMKYYTAEQLQELAATDTAELNSIVYYFTQSFTVEPVECYDCLPFDSVMFDVSKWEYLRLTDSVYTREFTKYGFRLTLVPVNQLPYTYAIHSVPLINPIENEQR